MDKLKKAFCNKYFLLFIILILASILRLYQLGTTPPSLEWDEASLGYNAYSLLHTGKDEYGSFLPLNLKSFGDYKPAFYAYADVPFVAIFGLNAFATRLPSALAGIGLVAAVFFLMEELLTQSPPNSKEKFFLPLLASLSVAISPLSLQFSRAAFESNVAVFLNILALLFLLKGFYKGYYFVLAALFFGLSLFTYQSSRLFIPLLLVGLIYILRTKIRINRSLIIGCAILGVFLGLIALTIFGFGQGKRLAAVSVFNYPRSQQTVERISQEEDMPIDSLPFQLLHGEWLAYVRGIAERYFIYYSPKTLFVQADQSPRHHVPDLGTLYFYSAILIPLGIYFLWKKRRTDPSLIIVFWIFLIAPMPAILARDLIDMIRSLNLVVPLSIFEGAGLYFLILQFLKVSKKAAIPAIGMVVLIMIINMVIYLDSYYVHMPKELAEGWVWGYKQAFETAGLRNPSDSQKYKHIVIDDSYGQPYIYYLFYIKYPPQKYQKQAVLDQQGNDTGTVRKIDNIEFRKINWGDDSKLRQTLLISTAGEIPPILPTEIQHTQLGLINFPDGKEAFRVVYAP